MMSSPKTKSNAATTIAKNLQSTISSPSSANASSIPRFPSPNRIRVPRGSHVTSSPPFRFTIDSPDRRRSVTSSSSKQKNNQTGNHSNGQKKTCMCSPTTHPGSFRCSFHRNLSNMNSSVNINHSHSTTTSYQSQSHRLYSRRSAMTNSLVRIGTVKGELVKRVLASLIRPSSNQQRRRGEFHPKPSRLSVMSKQEG